MAFGELATYDSQTGLQTSLWRLIYHTTIGCGTLNITVRPKPDCILQTGL